MRHTSFWSIEHSITLTSSGLSGQEELTLVLATCTVIEVVVCCFFFVVLTYYALDCILEDPDHNMARTVA
jgi:hypothetical protein